MGVGMELSAFRFRSTVPVDLMLVAESMRERERGEAVDGRFSTEISDCVGESGSCSANAIVRSRRASASFASRFDTRRASFSAVGRLRG